ncbi:MSCRAMM family protein [Agromyces arachidis]|uniref:MSCRAMM family protein n=1 Tax=Agromyces arachidis TaxID=766966 RepID=UPI004056FB00
MPGSAPRRSPVRTFARAALATLLSAGLGLAALQPASASVPATSTVTAEASASVSGVVTDTDGAPLADLLVYLMGDNGGSYSYTASDNTATDGSYRIDGVEAGTYSIRFFGDSGHVGEWWDDRMGQSDALTFEVAPGEHLSGMDAALSAGASISGVVTGADGAALPGATVRAYGPHESGDWGWLTSTTTDATGAYRFGVLRAGSHTLHVLPPEGTGLVDEWWGESPFEGGATRFDVARDEVRSDMDVQLPRAATITGVVTGIDGVPLPDVSVSVWTTNTPVGDEVTHYARTDDQGVYVIDGVKAARYRMKATPPVRLDYLETRSEEFEASAGVAVQQDAVLGAGGSIAGRVTGKDGMPLESAVVRIHPGLGPVDQVSTGADGSFRFPQLPGGSFTLHFDNRSSGLMLFDGSDYFPEWWDDASEPEERTFIDVWAGRHVTGVDAELTPESNITGRITSAEGEGIGGSVSLYEIRDGEPHYVKYAHVYPDGRYGVDDVRAGTYTLRFAATDHLAEWWGGGATAAEAETFTVGVGEVLGGRDVQLSRGASVAGSVTRPDGSPFERVFVTVSSGDAAGWQPVANRYTDANGRYSFSGLPAGTYIVRFAVDDAYVTQWWNDRTSADTAEPIVLDADGAATGIDAAMAYSPTRLTVPTITGSAWVGSTLTASAGSSTTGATLSYQWLADDVAIAGATARTVALDAAQTGKRIAVRVTASAPGRPSTTRTSSATDPVIAPPVSSSIPTIVGDPMTGSTLTASPGRWSSGTTLSYRWFANGIPVTAGTESSLVLGSAQAGMRITVRVTGTKPGYTTVSTVSAPTAEVGQGPSSGLGATPAAEPNQVRG